MPYRVDTSLIRDIVGDMNSTEHRSAVAAEVRAELARAGIRQADLADLAEISPQALSRKLHGKTPITVEELLRIAAALNLNPSDLLPSYTSIPLAG